VIDHLRDAVEQNAVNGDLGHLESRVAGMRNNFPADFYELLADGCQGDQCSNSGGSASVRREFARL
jgi:hypothetical protein